MVRGDELIKKVGNALKEVVKKEEGICEEIKIALKEEIAEGVISTRTIELHCPPEWKRKTKPKNEKTSFSKQVEEKPQQQIAATQDGKSVIMNETSSNTEASISKRTGPNDNTEAQAPTANQMKSVSFDEPMPHTKTDNINGTSLAAIDKLAQNRSGKLIESDLEKYPNCSVLRLHNQELEEALRKATTLSTADTLYSTTNIISNEESEIEFSLSYQYAQQYMAAEYQRGKSKVWFSVKINVKTKEVTSAKVGRISESEENWNDIR